MAKYIDLRNLFADDTLKNRVDVAVIIAASNLLGVTPTADEQRWAAAAFSNPRVEGRKAYMAVLAANKNVAVGNIQSASDAEIQSNVDSVVAALVVAHAVGG